MNVEHIEQTLRQDVNLHEAVKRNAMQAPPVPEALNTQLMERLKVAPHRKHRVWPWMAAACIAAAVVLTLLLVNHKDTAVPQLAKVSKTSQIDEQVPEALQEEVEEQTRIEVETGNRQSQRHVRSIERSIKERPTESVEVVSVIEEPVIEEPLKAENTTSPIPNEPHPTTNNPHALTPENMDRMIAQMAAYYKVQGLELNCSNNDDLSNGTMYVLPDDENIDIIARLYATLLHFDTSAPNIQLDCSPEQFFFCMASEKDGKTTEDCWIAERRRGRIYLYRTRSTEDEPFSSACFFDYVAKRDRKHNNYS